MTENEKRTQVDEDAQDDLELSEEDSAKVAGGAKQKADGSLDAVVQFKYDLKAQKEA